MSIRLMTRVFDLQLQSVATKMVLLILADYANDQGEQCFPSIPTVARKSGLSDRTVQRQVKLLEELTIIRREERIGHSSFFHLVIPPQGGDTMSPGGCHHVTTSGDKLCHPIDPPVDPPIKRERGGKAPFTPPTQEEAAAHASEIGLPEREVQKFFCHYQGNGWRVSKNPMRDWKATMTKWKLRWEDEGPHGVNGQANGTAKAIIAHEEFKRVEAKMRAIRDSYSEHQTMSATDYATFSDLRARKAQLKQSLGMQV